MGKATMNSKNSTFNDSDFARKVTKKPKPYAPVILLTAAEYRKAKRQERRRAS